VRGSASALRAPVLLADVTNAALAAPAGMLLQFSQFHGVNALGALEIFDAGNFMSSCFSEIPELPLFCDGEPLYVSAAGGDLRPTADSSSVEAGNPQAIIAPGSLDIRDLPRRVGQVVDVGAFEFQ